MGDPLIYRKVRELDVDPAEHPHGLSFLSAASGLVRIGQRLHVVADDEHHLGVFEAGGAAPVRLVRLFEGDLPESAGKRKKRKADLEVLLRLPPGTDWPDGALLALGSGSRPNRCRGALLALDGQGEVHGPARAIDLAPLYRPQGARFAELNIEGAFIAGAALHLLQRGGAKGPNACIRFALAPLLAWLAEGSRTPPEPVSITEVALGAVDGVPFGFTDGAALADGTWLFSAVAEQTDNSYDDGSCRGALLGIADDDGRVRWMRRLAPTRKVEGIEARTSGDTIVVGMVTDADDLEAPAEFGETTFPV
ncbi:MAG: hypothetical protein ABI699_09910, partial [Caldimonas sp.]